MDKRRKTVTGADPAAGVEISVTVPSGEVWKIIGMQFTLVASAVAGNRQVRLQFDNGSLVFLTIPTSAVQIVSQTVTYSYGAGIPASALETGTPRVQVQSLPEELVLDPGFKITTLTAGILGGDNFGAPVIYVEVDS